MASYRLSDESPDAKRVRPPWSPLGLFFLTWLFLPASVPFWFLNWTRLGHGQKRILCLVAALGAFALPFLLAPLPIDRQTTRLLLTLAKFAFAYFQLYAQRPLYEAHLARGGAKAPAWILWATAIAVAALQIGAVFAARP